MVFSPPKMAIMTFDKTKLSHQWEQMKEINICSKFLLKDKKKMFYLMTYSTHFIKDYMDYMA